MAYTTYMTYVLNVLVFFLDRKMENKFKQYISNSTEKFVLIGHKLWQPFTRLQNCGKGTERNRRRRERIDISI